MKKIFFLVFVFGFCFVDTSFGMDVEEKPKRKRSCPTDNESDFIKKRMESEIIVPISTLVLCNADLRGRDLSHGNFLRTNFEGADLSGALLKRAAFSCYTNLKSTVLKGVKFEEILIEGEIYSPEMTKAFFRNAGAIID